MQETVNSEQPTSNGKELTAPVPSCTRIGARYFALPVCLLLLAINCSLLTLLLGCRSTPPPTPLSQLNAQQTRGHDVFDVRCAQCHYDRTSGSLHGPSLLGVFKKPYLPSGAPANNERVTATILHGRTLMPGQPDIDPQDLNDLLAYLHTL